MAYRRLTRRTLVRRGIVGAVAAAASLQAAEGGAAIPGGNVVVGQFERTLDARAGIVSVKNGGSIKVALDDGAFVSQGANGIVDSIAAFIPGEQVVVIGAESIGEIAATDLQSVYSWETGVALEDRGELLLLSPSDRIVVPKEVVERDLPSGMRAGARYGATIWTHPSTRQAIAVDLTPQ